MLMLLLLLLLSLLLLFFFFNFSLFFLSGGKYVVSDRAALFKEQNGGPSLVSFSSQENQIEEIGCLKFFVGGIFNTPLFIFLFIYSFISYLLS
jgi:hypothetical protein